MKTKVLTGLAIAATLLIGQPVFAYTENRDGGGGARGGGAHVAVAHESRAPAGSFGATRNVRSESFATRGYASEPATRNYASIRSRGNDANFAATDYGARNSVAFGGGGTHNYGNGYGNNNRGGYASGSHNGWGQGQQYFWHGHHYRWVNNGWIIIDSSAYGDGDYDPGTTYDYGTNGGGNLNVQVQAALQQQGYYQGPVDGIVGAGTSQAIANYQQANGLRVTGTITPGLLNNLGIE
jgi:hypothetical protein